MNDIHINDSNKFKAPKYLVTAIVSAYNSEKYIHKCLEDLEAQTIAGSMEIIVVDTGSQQNEGRIVNLFQRNYENIKYIRTCERETIYQAWNRGIAAATGTYITNANTDDRHRPDAFERMVNLLESKPEVALVYADVAVTLNENETLESADIIGYFRWPDYNPKLLFKVCYVGPQPMWRKSLHDRYGYFDPMFKSAGDYEFWLRLAAKNEKFYHLPECLGLYLNSTYGMENSNTDLSFEESEMARVRNWKSTMGERPTPGGNYFVPELGQNPLVTIIVPTANRPELLIYALNSLIAQIYQNWEAIVVNDGGIGVSKLAETLDSKGRIKCLEHFTSFGPAAARNTALRLASGKIICYLDDDDVYLPHHLSTIVNAFHETSTSFIFTDSDHVVEKVQNGNRLEIVRKPAYPYSADQLGRLNEHLYVSNIIPINTWAHLRVCLIKTGFFDEALPSHEDWDLLLRFSKHYEFVHIPVVTTEIRERQDAADNVSSRQKHTYIEVFQKIYSRNKDLNTEFVINGRKSILKYLGHVKTQSYSAVILMNAKRFLDRYVYWRFRSFRRRPQ